MSLGAWLRDAADRWADSPAVWAAGEDVRFGDVLERATAIGAALRDAGASTVAVVGSGTPNLHAAMLGCMIEGLTFVPVSAAQPRERLSFALAQAGVDSVLLEPDAMGLFRGEDAWMTAGRTPGEHGLTHLRKPGAEFARAMRASPCYVMFTSGSSGVPKAVPISAASLEALLSWSLPHYGARESDVWAQTFDPSFDLSLFAPLVAWLSGAKLVYPGQNSLFALPALVREHAITCWFSVPTTAGLLCRLGFPDLPSLRLSMFCGEALPWSVAGEWRRRCPNSIVENVYGPTEATLFCSSFRVDPARIKDGSDGSWVPIGKALPGHEFLILDAAGAETGRGELFVSGPQVFDGYLENGEVNTSCFRDYRGARFYRTGDIASRLADGQVCFEGREDRQVKLNGYRVELAEVERGLRSVPGVSWALAYCRSPSPTAAAQLEAKVVGGASSADIARMLKDKLPPYMIPKRIEVVAAPPTLASGKIDAKALLKGED